MRMLSTALPLLLSLLWVLHSTVARAHAVGTHQAPALRSLRRLCGLRHNSTLLLNEMLHRQQQQEQEEEKNRLWADQDRAFSVDSEDEGDGHSDGWPHVVVATYFTPNIAQYAALSALVNTAWVRLLSGRQGGATYSLRVIDEAYAREHGLVEPMDERWNKIAILRHLLTVDAEGRRSTAVAWVDADLIVSDLNSFSLDALLLGDADTSRNRGSPDVWISRDMPTAPFVANTGFVVCRNSPWAVRFLGAWWGSFDRARCCDQHALNWLYHGVGEGGARTQVPWAATSASDADGLLPSASIAPEEVQRHVAVLPANALNSQFPAYRHQLPGDAVLHLAGASDRVVREPLFRRAADAVCAVVEAEAGGVINEDGDGGGAEPGRWVELFFPPQLGLDRSALQDAYAALPLRQVAVLDALLHDIQARGWNDFEADIALALSGAPGARGTNSKCVVRNLYALMEALNREVRGVLADVFKQSEEPADAEKLVGQREDGPARVHFLQQVRKASVNVAQRRLQIMRHLARSLLAVGNATAVHALGGEHTEACVDRDGVEHSPRELRVAGLEVLKEGFSAAVEFVLQLHASYVELGSSGGDSGQMENSEWSGAGELPAPSAVAVDSLEEWQHALELLSSTESLLLRPMERQAPAQLRPRVLYYQFKHRQLLATVHGVLAELTLRGARAGEESSAARSHESQLLAALGAAAALWEDLHGTHGYYGADYVLADPLKEGAELHGLLGDALCREGSGMGAGSGTGAQQKEAEDHLRRSVSLRQQMLRGYESLRIAPVDVVVREHAVLAGVLVRQAECLVLRQLAPALAKAKGRGGGEGAAEEPQCLKLRLAAEAVEEAKGILARGRAMLHDPGGHEGEAAAGAVELQAAARAITKHVFPPDLVLQCRLEINVENTHAVEAAAGVCDGPSSEACVRAVGREDTAVRRAKKWRRRKQPAVAPHAVT